MNQYVISKCGTFGVAHRRYISDTTGEEMLVIQWGSWFTPVRVADAHFLKSRVERAARREAEAWLYDQGAAR